MKRKNKIKELSYFGLQLQAFLKESHPQKLLDHKFIKLRSDIASEIYADSFKHGHSRDIAEELANEALYAGLLFSKYNTIRTILWEEFSYISEKEVNKKALDLLPICEEVFSSYSLHDEFVNSAEYNQLYTELIGQIDIWEEQNEL